MNANQILSGEFLDSDVLPSGHCVVKVLVRDCDGVGPGDTINVIPYITDSKEDE